MPDTTTRLTAVVETYLAGLRRVRASGGATRERSSYGPLANLLNAVGATLKPKVFCVGELADQGAGHPDFGLYVAKQLQKGQPREGQTPERGVVEVKAADDDAFLTVAGEQVSRYWTRYRLVLVTNTRDFVLVGEDTNGQPAKLETFRLADNTEAFARGLETPRSFARKMGAGLGEYLSRALAHRAALTEPKDVAWLFASYARDALHRVEAAGDAPSLPAVRTALEEALGIRFEGERGARFFRSTLVQTCSTASSPRGCSGRAPAVRPFRLTPHLGTRASRPPPSTGAKRSGTSVCRSCKPCFNKSPPRAGCTRWGSSRFWTGPPRRSIWWIMPPSSRASTKAAPAPTSTNPSWKPSIPPCANSWVSGTRQPKSCATWSPAWTRR